MRFFRLLVVVLLITLAGGLFGATVGGLMGYAVPSGMKAMFGVDKYEVQNDPDITQRDGGTQVSLGMKLDGGGGLLAQGAALGGAWGLVLGSMVALGVGLLDQLFLLLHASAQRRTNGSPSDSRKPQ